MLERLRRRRGEGGFTLIELLVVVIIIAAALITPTGDPFNLMLLAVPMYLLYELGILLARFVPQRRIENPEPRAENQAA